MNSFKIKFLLIAAGLALTLTVRADDKPDYNNDVKVTKVLRTSTNAFGQPIVYPQDSPAEVSILIIDIPPGKQTGWHKHPVPIFGYVLAGTITVHFANGQKNVFHKGDALAEAVNVLHNGVNEGTEPVKLLIFVAGEKNVPFTVKAPLDKGGKPLEDNQVEKSQKVPDVAPNTTKP